MDILTITFIIIWFLTGSLGFVYWWTNKHDYTIHDIPLTIFCGIGGLFGLFASWIVCGYNGEVGERTIIKRRRDGQKVK